MEETKDKTVVNALDDDAVERAMTSAGEYEPLTEEALNKMMQQAHLRGNWTRQTIALLVQDVCFWRSFAIDANERINELKSNKQKKTGLYVPDSVIKE
jgi:hypothetical protein